ncbi:type II toxin-antitoxin system VapC family toxin [uncultured Methanobrevibacter sp.]|uniref:type II toxin-antitoxin system VapC family toxin n=1 Tax=uncultured Methanobrevibacter sp. TaxID=253161 RepID=UPI0026031030|nr:type II toxin-antitoxin system VapC family toxin [uncultured Methanobrevibacter sp.]
MIFLDSTYLIGLMIDNDDYHEQAHQLRPIIDKERKLINNTVLVEVLNSLKKNNHKIGLDEIVDTLLNLDKVVFLTSEDYNESLKLFKYYNLSVNYSDCTIVKTMMDNNVSVVVSFDSDFDKIKGIRRIYL